MTAKPVRRTKTAFVKEHIGLSAGEIVARARKVGLEIRKRRADAEPAAAAAPA